ncbi:hypothetical protein [Leuconostoc gasicomitatum]|uniref:hypothetical protein n=1 Tax=Leuconostoc gasicomitatum TaxID=115778 RepID=UPI0007E26FB9|nr:hypothetical protein [Leuconostoc gasicomitatum]CUW06765.1 hypothetical protein PB1E_0749 [Leuconostoc gasicomitatum]
MTEIKITFKRNSSNKFDFKAVQNENIIFSKVYSPKESDNQHIMGEALAKTMQEWADKEIERDPEFKWHSFEEFKEWAGNVQLRKVAVKKYQSIVY